MRQSTVTMQDVAREAGVSRALVSLAVRGEPGVRPSTREHVLAIAQQMGYRVNRAASNLASRQTHTLGLFLLDLRQDVYADMFDGVREITDAHQRHLVLSVAAHDGSRDHEAVENLLQSRVDAILSAGVMLPDAEVIELNRQTPIVCIARRVPGLDCAVSDDADGARQATQHLLELGHRRIAFLANPQTDGYQERQRSHIETMAGAGLAARIVPSAYSRLQAAADIAPLLDEPPHTRPTAVFAHNDQAALGVLDAMAERGLRAPDDISVIGYDNTRISQAPGTLLTTVDLHGRELGRDAARLALTRISEPNAPARTLMSTPTLVPRRTTGPAPRS